MKEAEAIKYVKELGTLKFSFMTDNTVTYETVSPILIGGNYYQISVEFYIKDGVVPTVFCYDHLENMSLNDFQLAGIFKLKTDTIKEDLYFSKYKSTSIPILK